MRPRFVLALIACVAALAVAFSAVRASRARAELDSALVALNTAKSDVQELGSLRSRLGSISPDSNAIQDVLGRVANALGDAGLPASALKSVVPEGDVPLAAPGNASDPRVQPKLRTVSLTLEPITPGEIGTFLSAWRSRGGAWTATRIELVKSTAATPADAYIARLAITAVIPSEDAEDASVVRSPSPMRDLR